MNARLLLALVALPFLPPAHAQAWRPTKPVEIIVGVSPGGGIDRTARTVQKILQEGKFVDTPISVSNKPGGGGTIAQAYLNQRAGDAHYMEITATSLLTNQITGKTSSGPKDFTPIAMLYDEYIGVAVKADSPIKTGQQLLDALRQNPESLPVGIATSAGNTNHITAALIAKSAGIDPKRLKVVVFGSGGESMTALLGGHIGMVAAPSANFIPHMQGGRMTVLGIASPRRLEGALATVPTWNEQKVKAVVANWRPVIGPKGLTAPQIAFWEGVFGKLTAGEEWKTEVERSGGVNHYMGSRELARYLDEQHVEFRAVLGDLGLAK
jgi:putative tricarboxylic transport membrane protein